MRPRTRLAPMWNVILMQLVAGVSILGTGVAIFFAVNKKRSVRVEGIDSTTGERTVITRSEYGTRRSRWRGYCVIGCTLLGFQLTGLWKFFEATARGGTPPDIVRAVMYWAPWGMMFGLFAGNVLGTFSSRFIPEKTRPPDPDNP